MKKREKNVKGKTKITKKIRQYRFCKKNMKYDKKIIPTHLGNKSSFGETFFVETFNKINLVQKLFCLKKKKNGNHMFKLLIIWRKIWSRIQKYNGKLISSAENISKGKLCEVH